MNTMKRFLALFCISFLFGCSQKVPNPPQTTALRDGGNSSGGPVQGVSLNYIWPHIPTASGALQPYVTSFADKNVQRSQETLSGTIPPGQIRIEGISTTNGATYCFSNETPINNVTCARPAAGSALDSEIKSYQSTPTGRQTVFVSGLQFSFNNKPQTTENPADPNYWFSEAVFEGASVEKAPIVINPTTGAVEPVGDASVTRLSYANGCSLADPNAVGFDSVTDDIAGNVLHYLSGIYVFERSNRYALGETTAIPKDPNICQAYSGGPQWYCNLAASKTSVFYSTLFPVLYSNGTVGKRIYPNQVPNQTNGAITGTVGSTSTTFGLHPTATTGFVTTPVIGKVTSQGATVNGWEGLFIRKLCIRGKRRERGINGVITESPLILSLRSELRKPSVIRVR